ncbi:MAG: hypothetical protein GEU97_01920 [Actinophytocola sp.]|nr:hypothetical protein [Actinophytocola sp.]
MSPNLGVEIQSLREDAKVWDQAASDIAEPKRAVSGLTVNGGQDVTGMGERMGVDQTYERARRKVEELLGQGQEYLGVLADTLIAVANDYQAREQGSERGFRALDGELEGN